MEEYALYIMLGTVGVILFIALLRSRHFIKMLILNALSGCCALLAVYFIGDIIGVALPLNYFTLAVSAGGGPCGVIFLLLMNVICTM